MVANRAYKFRIYPNDEQKILFAKTFGCVRMVYNHWLDRKIRQYEENKTNVTYTICAKEMAEGLYAKTGCDVAISTTGIAGPTTPEVGKPVGLMYVAIKNKYAIKAKKVEVNPHLSRKMIKYLFTQSALEFLVNFLQENYSAMQQLSDSTTQDGL